MKRADEEPDKQPESFSESFPSAEPAPQRDTDSGFTPTVMVGGAPADGGSVRVIEANQVLAGRFRIVRAIGRGGMGEVYEAEDLQLRERVALKTVRAEVASQPRAAEAFLREIHLARRVTHPNVCRIFDLFHHTNPDGSTMAILSMELVSGVTLSEHLRRGGAMSIAEALPIAKQMATALDAAHARGVVHRDFKSGNVMLEPAGEGQNEPRAVVTDFGLAHGAAVDDAFASLSAAGMIVGTPSYMAPEQVTGGAITPATDVYAFGVVLYEMLTAHVPFEAESALATAAKRLTSPPVPPRHYKPDLDPVWEAVILRCLEREPAERFARAGGAAAVLAGQQMPAGRAVARPWLRPVLAGLAALAVLGLLWRALPKPTVTPPSATPTANVAKRRSVAVLGLKNLAGRPESAWLQTALGEMLASELAAGGRLRLVPGESVARVRLELSLEAAETLAGESLSRLRQNLGADLLVVGSYLALGDKSGAKLRLDLRVQDASSGEVLESVIENGTESDLAALVAKSGERLRAALGAAPAAAQEAQAARAAFAMDPAVARLYAEGLTHLRHFEAAAARDLLIQAARQDPRQPLVQGALADSWALLGYQQQAREAAVRSREAAQGLGREERLLIEARAHAHAFEWGAAVESYRTLFGFFPDSLDYGLRLAEAQAHGGHGQDALGTVETLRALPAPERDDPRIDLAEARAASAVSDFKRAAQSAARAAERGERSGARLIAADARVQQAWTAFQLGEGDDARKQAEQARDLYKQAGDRNGAAEATQLVAHVRWQRQGDHAGASQLYDEALAVFRETGNLRGVALALVNGAGPRVELGDLAGALQRCEQALPAFRQIADRAGEASTLVNLGTLALQTGQVAQARKSLGQALEAFKALGSRSGEAHAHARLGEAALAAGDFETARREHTRALALREALSEKPMVLKSRIDLARVALEAGQRDEAVRDTEACAREASAAGQAESEASARLVWTDALLRQGKNVAAREALAPLLKTISELGRPTRLRVEAFGARIDASAGPRDKSVERLRALLAEARQIGRVDLQFELRLALTRLGAEPGAALATEARALGLGLLAKQAGEIPAQR